MGFDKHADIKAIILAKVILDAQPLKQISIVIGQILSFKRCHAVFSDTPCLVFVSAKVYSVVKIVTKT